MDLDFRRAHPPLHALSTQQRRIMTAIEQYHGATGEPCPAAYLSRRFDLHHSTVSTHLEALYHKGFLRTPHAPATPNADESDAA